MEFLMIDHGSRQPMFTASLKGKSVRIVTDNHPDFRIQSSAFDVIDQGL